MLNMELEILVVTVANLQNDQATHLATTPAVMPPKKTNAVNDVVSNLIRAAAGASARNVSDQDVDKYVADLILKEAQEKRKKYDQIGVQAYKPNTPPSQKPKPNTRFLLNMVKATDSHNQAVIRANEENVAKLRQERLERESKKKEDERRSSRHHHHHRHRDRHASSDSKSKSKYKCKSDKEPSTSSSSRHKRHRSRSRSRSPSKSRRDRKKHKHTEEQVQFKGRGKVKINSSMDKYFSKGYDPLLDVESDKEDDYVFDKSDSLDDIGPKPPTKAWDAGKS